MLGRRRTSGVWEAEDQRCIERRSTRVVYPASSSPAPLHLPGTPRQHRRCISACTPAVATPAGVTRPWALTYRPSLGEGTLASRVSSFLFSFDSRMSSCFPDQPRERIQRSDEARATRLPAAYGRHLVCGRHPMCADHRGEQKDEKRAEK